MTERQFRKKWIIYPEDNWKPYYDVFICLIIVISCIFTPLDIAFFGMLSEHVKWYLVVIDVIFLTDILINFNSAFYDSHYDCIDDRKEIANNYIKGWFFLDLIAILPIENSTITRLGRIVRLSRLVKLSTIMAVFKRKKV